jgi:flagellar basal-body rod modification protein FlgD
MSSAISPISSSLAASSASSSAALASSSTSGLADQSTFLTLLVTQLQNQDPLNPADSTQFVTQLAQFSQLEDLQNINQNVITISGDLTAAAPASTPTA